VSYPPTPKARAKTQFDANSPTVSRTELNPIASCEARGHRCRDPPKPPCTSLAQLICVTILRERRAGLSEANCIDHISLKQRSLPYIDIAPQNPSLQLCAYKMTIHKVTLSEVSALLSFIYRPLQGCLKRHSLCSNENISICAHAFETNMRIC